VAFTLPPVVIFVLIVVAPDVELTTNKRETTTAIVIGSTPSLLKIEIPFIIMIMYTANN